MKALGFGGGVFGPWDLSFKRNYKNRKNKRNSKNSNKPPSSSPESFESRTCKASMMNSFPLRQAITAGSLALAGDTIAQLSHRWRKRVALNSADGSESHSDKDEVWSLLMDHDWIRAFRMTSYGFLLYGPGSYAWYQYLDRQLPKQTVRNIITKVVLNQIVLGPSVIAVIFAWNNLWQGKISQLPEKYKKDALPTLLYGFRFWIPVSVLNFWVVPLQARVAFMSMGSIFWNFILSRQ